MDCVCGLMFVLSQTHFIFEQFFKKWLFFEELADLGSSSGSGMRCLCHWSRWADLEPLVSWLSSSFPFGPSSFLLYRSTIDLKWTEIIRSECLTCICTVQVTPRWGHSKSGSFYCCWAFFSCVWIPSGTWSWDQLRALRIALCIF